MGKANFLLSLIIVSSIAFAGPNTQYKMREVFEKYVELIPSIYGDQLEVSVTKIKGLEDAFKNSQHDTMLRSSQFSPLSKAMIDNLGDVRQIQGPHNQKYIKYRLKKVLASCTSCHSQLPEKSYTSIEHGYEKLFNKYIKGPSDKAMLAYFLRDYQKAEVFLKEDIKDILNNKKSEMKLESSLILLAKVSLMNLNEKNEFKAYLKELMPKLKDFNLSSSLVKTWLDSDIKKMDHSLKANNIKAIIKNVLMPLKDELVFGNKNTHAMVIYEAQGILSNYLVQNKKGSLYPEVLYWLGIIENQSYQANVFSLGELYFKQCILDYPQSDISKKCYQAYEDSVVYGFTGTRGTQLPKDVEKELNDLKAKVKM